MSDKPKPPTEFDAYAGNYGELVRDPIRDRFAASTDFFFKRKIQVIETFYRKRGISTNSLAWLDVGCGRGDLMRAGQTHFQSVSGCDPSEEMLKACAPFDVRRQDPPDKLPFDDGAFDFVTAVSVYHHVPPEGRALLTLEMKRLLKPDGIMCIIEHNPLNPVTRVIVARAPVDANAQLLRLREARRLLLDSGARIIDWSYFLLLPQFLHRRLASLESALSGLPLGGQYAVFAQK